MNATERKKQALDSLNRRISQEVYSARFGEPEVPPAISLDQAIDAYAAACVAERLATTTKLGHCRGIVDAINEACTCGGGSPPSCCPACEVFHAIKDMEIAK